MTLGIVGAVLVEGWPGSVEEEAVGPQARCPKGRPLLTPGGPWGRAEGL